MGKTDCVINTTLEVRAKDLMYIKHSNEFSTWNSRSSMQKFFNITFSAESTVLISKDSVGALGDVGYVLELKSIEGYKS